MALKAGAGEAAPTASRAACAERASGSLGRENDVRKVGYGKRWYGKRWYSG